MNLFLFYAKAGLSFLCLDSIKILSFGLIVLRFFSTRCKSMKTSLTTTNYRISSILHPHCEIHFIHSQRFYNIVMSPILLSSFEIEVRHS